MQSNHDHSILRASTANTKCLWGNRAKRRWNIRVSLNDVNLNYFSQSACLNVSFRANWTKASRSKRSPGYHYVPQSASQSNARQFSLRTSLVDSSGIVCRRQLIEVVQVAIIHCFCSWAASPTSKMLRCMYVFIVVVISHLCVANEHRFHTPGRHWWL